MDFSYLNILKNAQDKKIFLSLLKPKIKIGLEAFHQSLSIKILRDTKMHKKAFYSL
jgi:hypothetical protein